MKMLLNILKYQNFKMMNFEIKKFCFLLVLTGLFIPILQAQVEEEEEMPEFVDTDIEEPKEDTWPLTMDTVRWSRTHKQGFVCNKTEVLIPFEYTLLPKKFAPLMVARKGGKAGVINDKNEVVVPFEYDGVTIYFNSFSVFKREGKKRKYGIINSGGEKVLPTIYGSTAPYTGKLKFNNEVPAYSAKINEPSVKTLFFSKDGKLLYETPHRIYNYANEKYIKVVGPDYKHGVMKMDNTVALEAKYTHVSWVHGDIASVRLGTEGSLMNLKDLTIFHTGMSNYKKPDSNNNCIISKTIDRQQHQGLFNLEGEIVYPLNTGRIYLVDETDLYQIYKDRKLADVIDAKGNSVANSFDKLPVSLKSLEKGYFAAKNEKNQWLIYDKDRKRFTEEIFYNVILVKAGYNYHGEEDVQNIIAIVANEKYKEYYLFTDGRKVEK